MPKFLWVKWEDGGPRAKRFRFFSNKIRKRDERSQIAHGLKYVVLRGMSPHRGTPGSVDLMIEDGADPEEVAKVFVAMEGGILTEFWEEIEHE